MNRKLRVTRRRGELLAAIDDGEIVANHDGSFCHRRADVADDWVTDAVVPLLAARLIEVRTVTSVQLTGAGQLALGDPVRPPLPTVTVRDIGSVLTMPCEPIGDGRLWAITPETAVEDAEVMNPFLTGRFWLVHVPTGRPRGGWCLRCCRDIGKRLLALDLDWTTYTDDHQWLAALAPRQRRALDSLRELGSRCEANSCGATR